MRADNQAVPPKRYLAGRRCGAFGCRQVLSIYNRGPNCWMHGGHKARRRH